MRLDISLSTKKDKELKESILKRINKDLVGRTDGSYIDGGEDYIGVIGNLEIIKKVVKVLEDLGYD